MSNTVSVAIAIYNGARFLSETIRSLLAQSMRDFRLICVDDHSTDDSVAIARSFGDERLSITVAERHGSLPENWNRAVQASNSDYFVVAHQDDVYEPRFLERMLQVIETHPRAFAAHCRATTIDENGNVIAHPAALFKDRFWPRDGLLEREPAEELAVLRRGNYVIAPSVIYRREATARIGLFDTHYRFVTDWEYSLRGLRAGYQLIGVPEALVCFRRHEETATRDSERTLLRYEEELELLSSLPPAPRAFEPLENNLLADFAQRLAERDHDAAAALARFAERIPGSNRASWMRAALRGGSFAGHALLAARWAYLRMFRKRIIAAAR